MTKDISPATAEGMPKIERAPKAARLARASVIDQRIAAIRSELKAMEYGDFIPWSRHHDLSAELARLS